VHVTADIYSEDSEYRLMHELYDKITAV